MPSKPMTFGLVSSSPKRYEDNPSRNEPHVILYEFRDGGSGMTRMYRDYATAQKDLHIIDLIGEVNDRRVKDTYIIPVSKVNDVFPDITAETVRRRGYVPQKETLEYQWRMNRQRATPSASSSKKKPPVRTRRN